MERAGAAALGGIAQVQSMLVQGWVAFDWSLGCASVHALASWHVNAVRVPVTEDCWLGITGALAGYSGGA